MTVRTHTASLRRHRVYLCTQNDVVVDNGTLVLIREKVKPMWAEIFNKPEKGTLFTPDGFAYKDTKETHSHRIRVLYDWRYNISNLAWIYEERRKSPPRWFKIIGLDQTEGQGTQYFMFYVRLTERSDEAVKPVTGEQDLTEPNWASGYRSDVQL